MRILITSGATREPIDAVRFLSNVSTGATGAALADTFHGQGHEVTLLHGTGAVRPQRVTALEEFTTAADLRQRLQRRLARGKFHVVVMCAAVSDYRPRRTRAGKISSAAPGLTLPLVRNEKILPRLKSFSPRPLTVVGFKLTAGATATARRRAVNKLFAAGGADFVVANDLSRIRDRRGHPFSIHDGKNARGLTRHGAPALAATLGQLVSRRITTGLGDS
jgi:phosphopantothenoylcysteine synthetase/decarboxylase